MELLRRLRAGATIGVLAPGSSSRPELVAGGVKQLESEGYQVSIPFDPSKNYGRTDGFSSGTIKERLDALYTLLEDPEVLAIICARGAYGSMELLPHLDFGKVARARKAIIGYSDITALVSVIPRLSKIPAIHGPTLTKEFAEANKSQDALSSSKSLLSLLRGESILPIIGKQKKNGHGQGRLIVGNLTVLCSLLGSPYEADFNKAILVVEDVGESPYRIHRLLMQLKLAGKLDSLAALVFGRFSCCTSKNPPSVEETIDGFIAEQLNSLYYPVLTGLDLGHGGINLPLPCGATATVENGQLTVVDKIVE